MQFTKTHTLLAVTGAHLLFGLLAMICGSSGRLIAPDARRVVFLFANKHPASLALFNSSVRDDHKFAVSGKTTRELVKTIRSGHFFQGARAIVVLIGFDESDGESQENELKVLSAELPEDIPTIWLAAPPVNERRVKSGVNARISKFNRVTKSICAELENCSFHDLSDLMADEDGNLKAEFHSGDGINLNNRGQLIWVKLLKSLLS